MLFECAQAQIQPPPCRASVPRERPPRSALRGPPPMSSPCLTSLRSRSSKRRSTWLTRTETVSLTRRICTTCWPRWVQTLVLATLPLFKATSAESRNTTLGGTAKGHSSYFPIEDYTEYTIVMISIIMRSTIQPVNSCIIYSVAPVRAGGKTEITLMTSSGLGSETIHSLKKVSLPCFTWKLNKKKTI